MMNSKKKGEEGSSSFLANLFRAKINDSEEVEEDLTHHR
jgi:hypothetical protein